MKNSEFFEEFFFVNWAECKFDFSRDLKSVQCTAGWNDTKSPRSFHRQKPLSHELGSEWVSAVERESEASSAAQVNANEWASERTSEWPITVRVDFIVY